MQATAVKKEYNKKQRVSTTTFYKQTINPQTGEIEYVPVSRKEIRYGQQKFVRVNTKMLLKLTDGLSKSAYRLLLYFMDNIDQGNVCKKAGADIAEDLSMPASTFDRAITELRDHEIIVSCKYKEWMLCPDIGICCEEENRVFLQDKFERCLKRKPRSRTEEA